MIIPAAVKLFVYMDATDMRKGFNGLSALVINEMSQDPLTGNFYIFRNKKKDKLKLLYWDRSGYAIWYKQLQEGKFHFPLVSDSSIEIDISDLSLILEGIDLSSAKQQKRFALPRRKSDILP